MSYLIFLAIGIINLFLLPTHLYGGDSAEYALTSTTFSIPHAPGYPLYTLLGNIISRLVPLSTANWRIALLSLIPSILTLFIIYKIITLVTKSHLIALFTALFYFFLFPVWLNSLVPEVFSLNSFFITLITYLILLLNKKYRQRLKNILFFLLGLALTNHYIIIIFIPGWHFLIDKNIRRRFLRDNWPKSLLFILLGLSLYIYAPIASYFNPPVDWENAKSLAGFVRLVTRSSFGTFKAYATSKPILFTQLLSLSSVFIDLVKDFRILGIFFIVVGFIFTVKKYQPLLKFITITVIICLFFFFYSNYLSVSPFDLASEERFLTFIYFIFLFPLAIGVHECMTFIKQLMEHLITNNLLIKITNIAVYIFIFTVVLIEIRDNYKIISQIRNLDFFDKSAEAILKSSPKQAILLASQDETLFPLMDKYYGGKIRNDIKLIDIGLLGRDYYIERLRHAYPDIYVRFYAEDTVSPEKYTQDFLDKNAKHRQIFSISPYTVGYWLPYGLTWKYYPSKTAATSDINNVIAFDRQFWQNFPLPKLNDNSKSLLYFYSLQKIAFTAYVNYGKILIDNDHLAEADAVFRRAYNYFGEGSTDPDLINSFVEKKDCKMAKYYLGKMDQNNFLLTSNNVKILIKYFGICHIKISDPEKYVELYNKLQIKEGIPLNSLK